MCYGTQLVLEFDEGLKQKNRKTVDRLRKLLVQDASLGQRHYASAFARPFWPVITAEHPEEAEAMQWGLVPAWVKEDPKDWLRKAPTFNAISETAYDKPSYRGAMNNGRRCLIPVTGFFEWHHLGKLTYPHFIKVKGQEVFFLAGIYERGTYSILTCPANSLMAEVHNQKKRMPVILPVELEETWLRAGLTKEEVLALCVPYPADGMETWTVGRGITARGQDPNTPQASLPVEYPELAGASWLHVGGSPAASTP